MQSTDNIEDQSASTQYHNRATALLSRAYASHLPEWLVLAIAALTRLWRLNYHSIWFDESVSLNWSGADPSYTWRITFQLIEEKHPPVYYISLHYWREFLGLFGLSHADAAIRVFGSLLGILTVIGILLLVKRLSGRPAGLLTGLLVALSPVLVWYSQELRMFQPAATGAVWTAYALLRVWEGRTWQRRLGWWLLFVLVLEAALYTYLFSAFVAPAAGLTLLALAIVGRKESGNWHRFGEGLIALAVLTLLFLPLANNAWGVSNAESTPGQPFADFVPNLLRELKIFTFWRMDWPHLLLWLLGALALIGVVLPGLGAAGDHKGAPLRGQSIVKNRQPRVLDDRIWLLIWIGAPLLVANVLLSRSGSVFREDRYLIFMAPFVLWAIARGVIVLGERWRAVGWAVGLVVTLMIAASLPRLWTPDAYRENWRAAADYIVDYQHAGADLPAAIVTHVDYTRRPLQWYLEKDERAESDLPVFHPFGSPIAPGDADAVVGPPIQGIMDNGAATLWLTQSHLEGVDDERVVQNWLSRQYPLVTEQFPTGINLTGYALQSRFDELPELSSDAHFTDAEIVPGLTLVACELITPVTSAGDQAMHPPSGWVHVRLWWRADAPLDDDYIATAQMVGEEGVWGDRLYRGNEALRRWPTSTWQPGEIVRDEIDINLNPVTPDGEYPVLIGVMDGAGEPVGARVECGRVKVTR